MPLYFPSSPTNGQTYENFVYDSSITAWRNQGSPSGLAGQVVALGNSIGLKTIPVQPSQVVIATGTGSVSTNGSVTFAGATAVSLNNVFTDAYTNYKILLRLDNSSAANTACFRFRNSGTDDQTSNYNRAGYYINVGGSLTGWTAASQTLISVVNMDIFTGGSTFAFAELTAVNPKQAVRTILNATALGRDSIGAWQNTTANTVHNGSTSFDGFTFFPNGAGTFGGTIQVLGFNQ